MSRPAGSAVRPGAASTTTRASCRSRRASGGTSALAKRNRYRPLPEPDMDDSPQNQDLAPELHNAEQDDEDAQAQTIADEALRSRGEIFSDTEKVPGGDPGDGTPDLIDHMRQMATSGRIDMSAFRGERNDVAA